MWVGGKCCFNKDWCFLSAAGHGSERAGGGGEEEEQRQAGLVHGEDGEPAGGHERALPGVEGLRRGQPCMSSHMTASYIITVYHGTHYCSNIDDQMLELLM